MYSAVRPVVFDSEISWQVYPNPSGGLFNFVYQVNEGEKMTIKVYDVNARLVKEFSPVANGFVQKATIDIQPARYAPGLYLIEASDGEKKAIIQGN
ncbi:MAG: T9SS type A sorting domain-containing protein [Bacteroidota bacterium]